MGEKLRYYSLNKMTFKIHNFFALVWKEMIFLRYGGKIKLC